MPGTTPPTSQLDWLSSTTAMIVLFWSRATRDLLKSFGWGIAATPSVRCSDEVAPFPRRPPHSIFRFRASSDYAGVGVALSNFRTHVALTIQLGVGVEVAPIRRLLDVAEIVQIARGSSIRNTMLSVR